MVEKLEYDVTGLAGATEAGVIAELARAAAQPQVVDIGDGKSMLVLPPGYAAQEIRQEDWQSDLPLKRVKQGVTVQTTDSLVDYVQRFKTGSTMLFADIDHNTIVAVVDYHARSDGEAAGAPARGAHRASMVLPYSAEWKHWLALDDKRLPQLDFARMLEESRADISAPAAADLIEICRDLQAVRNVDFRSAVRTNQDNESFEYVDETKTQTKSGSVQIPTEFTLNIPVYFGGRNVEVTAYLRHRFDDGKLFLGVKLHRPDHVRQAIFKEIVDDVGARTGRTVVFGRPSAS